MKKILKNTKGLFHIQFQKSEIDKYSEDDLRRIRMVNYIGTVSIFTMLSYVVLYVYLDFNLFKPSIIFLSICSLLAFGIMLINKRGFYKSGKFLLAIANTVFIFLSASWMFGEGSGFHTFLLATAIIPLFIWPLSKPYHLGFFISLSIGLYIVWEFFPPSIDHLIELPAHYVNIFKGTNVLVCFSAAGIAIAFYIIIANKNENRLLIKTQELEQSQRHQDLVYSVIAHDLRSPFNTLIGLLDLLNHNFDALDDSNKKEALSRIYGSSANLQNLLDNLLDWSKAQSGTYRINIQNINLELLIRETIDLMSDVANEKQIIQENKVDSQIKVMADYDMISTVMRNLINNAIKYSPKGGKIKITSKKIDKMIRVCIADTGVGIPEKYSGRLFDINSTFTCQGTNKELGSGLGLKLCGDFIKKNGGNIWVESELEKGSRFYFTLKTTNSV
jgi:signal transduction histidine kinase